MHKFPQKKTDYKISFFIYPIKKGAFMEKIFISISVLLFLGCSKVTVDNSVISDFNLNRYLGKWYEIARFDHSFEKEMENTSAKYSLRQDGKISVINTGIKNGKLKESKGVAKTTDTTAVLRVSFFRPFYADYRILMLDKNYTYALVGSNSDNYLWILSRTKRLSSEEKNKLLQEARKRGYKTENLIWVKHSSDAD